MCEEKQKSGFGQAVAAVLIFVLVILGVAWAFNEFSFRNPQRSPSEQKRYEEKQKAAEAPLAENPASEGK